MTRWHQNFDVDAVPEVPAAGLPTPPDVKTFSTAKDVLGNLEFTLFYFIFYLNRDILIPVGYI